MWALSAALCLCAFGPAAAWGQSAATCVFDPGAAAVTVALHGIDAQLRAAPSGNILLDGTSCGGATVSNTDSVQIVADTPFVSERISLSGTFAPGLTPEATGVSEIEISVGLESFDDLVVLLRGGADRLRFAPNGIDVGNDFDADIMTAGEFRITVQAGAGDDEVDASAYQHAQQIFLHGRDGNDHLVGGPLAQNKLYGEAGNDTLLGGDTFDDLDGGPGDDVMFGRGGEDWFVQGTASDGADDMRGGAGTDWVDYRGRTSPVTVTMGNAQPDGEAGEGDKVRRDVENAYGGRGDDVLVGTYVRNYLDGWSGDDEVYGGGGDDVVRGETGSDILVGDDGDDILQGDAGNDFLDGGPGRDSFQAWDGADTIANADGFADQVDCGAGSDDAEPDPLDTFVDCEL